MSVKVAVRVRPFNSRQRKLNCECVIDMVDPSTKMLAYKEEQQRTFTFDYSFWSFDQYTQEENGYLKPTSPKYCDQRQVFQKIGKNILDNAWKGYHCTLFAYGQTGSGKSYSMIGFGQNKGLVPVTCSEIFQRIKAKKASQQFQVHVSMMEIYNQDVHDLTIPIDDRPKSGLKIRQNKLLGVYVDGVKKHFVSNFDEIETVMENGTKNRAVAATQMNATSSRAHTIITVEFKQITKAGSGKTEKVSMINLVDLAGSQRQDKTGATGQRLKQAVGINQSLTSLGQVISVLADNADGANKYVPYRNSALTRILQNALGGNSQTIMICAISPASDNYDESLSTLRYADRAKKIVNKPIVNESQTDKLIKQLKAENERLKKLLEGKGGGQVPKKIEQQKKEQNKGQNKGQNKELKGEEQGKGEVKKKQEENKSKDKKGQQQKKQNPLLKEQNDDQGDTQQDIKAKMQALQRQISNEKKTIKQKRQQALKQNLEMEKHIQGAFQQLFMQKDLQKMEKKGTKFPPYFQNISKDLMIHRKLKIMLKKQKMTVGKKIKEIKNDIIFGGRDILPRHAQIHLIDGKTLIMPSKGDCHLYVNGTLITQTTELHNMDRVIFGWNSVYLYRNKSESSHSKLKEKEITWDFIKKQVQHLVDIDASDTEDGGGCCEIF